jgi:hypothetical protein
MRLIRRIADGSVSLFVKKIDASAIWYTQCACEYHNGSWHKYTRQVNDGSGYCTAWSDVACCGVSDLNSCYSYRIGCNA